MVNKAGLVSPTLMVRRFLANRRVISRGLLWEGELWQKAGIFATTEEEWVDYDSLPLLQHIGAVSQQLSEE